MQYPPWRTKYRMSEQFSQKLQSFTVRLAIKEQKLSVTGIIISPELILTHTPIVKKYNVEHVTVNWQNSNYFTGARLEKCLSSPYWLSIFRLRSPIL